MTPLLDRKLLFVTGKGGVGKTTIAAGLALLASHHGKKTLVAEVDAKGNLADYFEVPPTTFDAREIAPNLFAMSMHTEESLKEYLRLQLKIPVLARIGPLARTFDFVAQAAPGVKEVLTVGKFLWEVREQHYDIVVVDAAATGHVISQLDAPEAIQELVAVGPIRNQTGWLTELLSDPALTALNVVTSPEEMPVNETIELVARARQELNVPLGVVIVNRVLPELFTHADETVFDALREPAASEVLTRAAGPGAIGVLDAARLAVTMRRGRSSHLGRLCDEVDLPLLLLPYLFVRDHGLRVTRMVAEALGQELGY